MIPPGKTTFARMQSAAHNEAVRIEISQDGRVSTGMMAAPMPDQVLLRDDFAGIVRLIDLIESDPIIVERLKKAMVQTERQLAAEPAPAPPADDVVVYEEEAAPE
jgi:hypothetical protein